MMFDKDAVKNPMMILQKIFCAGSDEHTLLRCMSPAF